MDHIRVATFNVRHCRGPDDRVDVERTARTIRALAVDVLALQELDAGWERSGGEDQPARLAELTGLTVSFYPTISHEGSYGIALAGNRLEDVHLESLPRVGNEEPRAVIVARRDGTTFLATHLSRREGARRAQVRRLAEIAREVTPPVVIVGDLNTSVRGLAPLLDEGFDPGPPTPHAGQMGAAWV